MQILYYSKKIFWGGVLKKIKSPTKFQLMQSFQKLV